MAALPAKRQRKLIVLSSSDNEAESKTDRISSVAATGPDYNQKQNKLSYSGSAAQVVNDRDSSSSERTLKKPKKTSDICKGSEKNVHATTARRRQKGLKEEGSLTTSSSLSPDTKKRKTTKSKKSGTGVVASNGNTAQKSKQQQQRQDGTTQSLHNFFQPATDEQRWSFSKSDLGTRQASSFAEQLEDDLIEDDWFDADALLESAVYSSRTLLTNDPKGQKTQKDRLGNGAGRTVIPIQSKGIPRPVSKRFILDADDESVRAPEETGQKPWSEQYPPALMDQLAVHKKKVADVRDWLHAALSGGSRRHKILVLHGPAGCGKTATVSLLSNELDFDIVDWRNPFGTDTDGRQYSSLSSQFDDFLSQLNGFGGLHLSDSSSTTRTQAQSTSQAARKRVILIEEFPANLSWGSTALSSFQNSLRQYLASGLSFVAQKNIFRNSTDTIPPIVIIISETMLNSSGSTSDNLTAHRLLGPEVYSHPAATTIEFNPIAPTFMLKALQLILQKEASRSKRQWIPGTEVLKRLSELGDIRSAVSALEFLCLRNDKTSPEWSGRVAWKSSKTTAPLTAMERESLELITQRESSLGLFHAVGKVVYNKRDDTPQDVRQQNTHVAPPSHLRHLDRPKVSQVFVEDMMDRTGTDVHTFTAALHENYPPSCDGMNFTETLEGCIESLSDSDILGSETRSYLSNSRNGVGTARSRFLGYGASVDRLRQDEISFQVAVRGLLFSLPYPVRRRVDARLSSSSSSSSSSTKGTRVGPFKLYYPTSQRLWKEVEEIEGLVTLWERQLLMNPSGVKQMNGDTNNRLTDARYEGVASWKMNAMNSNANLNTTAERHDSHELHMPSLVSREDMLLLYLPYLAKIVGESPVASAQRLTRITRFEGLTVPPEDDDLVGDSIMPEEADATRIRAVDSDGVVVQRQEEEHLFLSDDDIED